MRSGDASAWIEVKVDGIGWVPVSVSPPRSREPDAETAVASEEQVATPNPPPPPQVPPDVDVFTENEELEEPVEEDEEEDEEDDEAAGASGIGTLGWVAIGVGSSLLLVAIACGTIIVWKRRRTRRRREAADPAARIAGAWLELTDRYEEAGVTDPRPGDAARSGAFDGRGRPEPRRRPRPNWSVSPARSTVPRTTGRARPQRPPTPPGAILTRPWMRCSPTSRSPVAPACGSTRARCDAAIRSSHVGHHRPP